MNSKNIQKELNFKMFKVVKFMFKTKFSHYFLSSIFHDKFEDLILIFCI